MTRSKLSDRRTRHDEFHRRARQGGFASRAVFKLEEIDEKLAIFHPGDRVLDLGCAPGSWFQYAQKRIGPTGFVMGVDRKQTPAEGAGYRLVEGDVFELGTDDLLAGFPSWDVVLSDMAPDTTGIRHVDQARSEVLFERALEIATATLAPHGRFVGKIFQGPEFQSLVATCRQRFERVKVIKPQGSRKISIEQYICATGFRPVSTAG